MSKHKEREAKFWKRARRDCGNAINEKECPACCGDGKHPTCHGQGCMDCNFDGLCRHCFGNGMLLR